MEFQGQRGDPLSAWSVGKYAKRSATIHLCSEDCQTTANQVFSSTIATYTDNGSVSVFDTGKKIRDAIQDGQEPRVRVYNPGFNTTLDKDPNYHFRGKIIRCPEFFTRGIANKQSIPRLAADKSNRCPRAEREE